MQSSSFQSLLIRLVLLSEKQLLCGVFSPLEAQVYFSRIMYLIYASSETSLVFLSCQAIAG